jgi:putative ABC transport system substrate-binding protein
MTGNNNSHNRRSIGQRLRLSCKQGEKNIMFQNRTGNWWTILIWVVVFALFLSGCGGATQAKTYTIGAVNYNLALDLVFDGFKAGMADLGYVEGENVTYIYNGLLETDPQVIDREIESLLAQDVDLLFTLGTVPVSRAKQAVEGTDIPVIFAPVVNPVGEGVVESIRHPGGNVTGIQLSNEFPKALEWLLTIAPETTKVYLAHNPGEEVSVMTTASLSEAASTLGVELILDEVSTAEEMIAAIETLPEDVAIFMTPIPFLEPHISDIYKAVTERGIAAVSINAPHVEMGALVTYGIDLFPIGEQAARLADQALRGTAPADLPVETTESFLSINLKVAEAIGLDIPDEIVRQADTVVR